LPLRAYRPAVRESLCRRNNPSIDVTLGWPLSCDINPGLVHVVRTLYQSEGMRGLYRGITPELLKERAVSLVPYTVTHRCCVAITVASFSPTTSVARRFGPSLGSWCRWLRSHSLRSSTSSVGWTSSTEPVAGRLTAARACRAVVFEQHR
jgi:hypothetical protein